MAPLFVHLTDEVLSDGICARGCHWKVGGVGEATEVSTQNPTAVARNSNILLFICFDLMSCCDLFES